MARIAGVNLPREKRLEVALTYIFGIGRSTAVKVANDVGISRDTKVNDLEIAIEMLFGSYFARRLNGREAPDWAESAVDTVLRGLAR